MPLRPPWRAPVSSTVIHRAQRGRSGPRSGWAARRRRPRGGGREPGTQHLPILGDQAVEPTAQQAHHLPLGDRHADPRQQRREPLGGHLALDVAGEQEPAQGRAEPALDPGRQGCRDRLSVRGPPAFAAVADHARHQEQVLDDDVLVALEARSGWHRDREHLVLDAAPPVALGAAPAAPPRSLAGRRRRGVARPLQARGLPLRPRRQPLEPGDLVLQLSVLGPQRGILLAQPDDLVQQPRHQGSKIPDRQRLDLRGFGQRHRPGGPHLLPPTKPLPTLMPGNLPRLLRTVPKWCIR
jgi:hypothetical protein